MATTTDGVWEPCTVERLRFHAIEWDGQSDEALQEFLRRWVSEHAYVTVNDTVRNVSLSGRTSVDIHPGDMVVPYHIDGYPGIRTMNRDEFLHRYQEADLSPEQRLRKVAVELLAAVRGLNDKAEQLAKQAEDLALRPRRSDG